MGLEEYIETLKGLVENNTDEAIKFLFKVYDADGKNLLTSISSPLSLVLLHFLKASFGDFLGLIYVNWILIEN